MGCNVSSHARSVAAARRARPGATISAVVAAHAHPHCALINFNTYKKDLSKPVNKPVFGCNYAALRRRSLALREQNTVCWVCKQVLIKRKGVPERVCTPFARSDYF